MISRVRAQAVPLLRSMALTVITHRTIVPLLELDVDSIQNRVITVYPLYSDGSLYDLIHGVDRVGDRTSLGGTPRTSAHHADVSYLEGDSLSGENIARMGADILQALGFFLQYRIPFFHLSSDRILLESDSASGRFRIGKKRFLCHVGGLERSLLGLSFPHQTSLVPALLWRYQKESMRLDLVILWTIAEQIMVIQFGHVLYEMMTGCRCPYLWPTRIVLSSISGANTTGRGPTRSSCLEVLESIFGRLKVVYADSSSHHDTVSFPQPNIRQMEEHIHRIPTLKQLEQHTFFLNMKSEKKEVFAVDLNAATTATASSVDVITPSDLFTVEARALLDIALETSLLLV